MGLTGGEPLLNFDDTLAFLARAHELFGDAHKRMYTSGDLLTREMAERLRDAGLDEIRFSIKQDDTDDQRERVLANMKMATEYIPSVMVEMPIIPGTGDAMREWMRRFDEAGIDGMNLLEFCFPFHSWDEFAKRGFELQPALRRHVRLQLLGRSGHRRQSSSHSSSCSGARGPTLLDALLLARQQAP